MNNIFKIDKSLTTENKKISNAFINQSNLISQTEQPQQRKAVTMDTINIKKVDTSVEIESNESEDGGLLKQRTLQQILEEEYDGEGQSAKMSESPIQKQYLKQQRIQNQKQGEDSFNKMKNSQRNSYLLVNQQIQSSEAGKSRSSQESFDQNIQISRRHTDRQEQIPKQMNYFVKQPQEKSTQQSRNQTEFKLDMAVQVSSLESNNLNKSIISKSSIDMEQSSKEYQQIDNQDILQLFVNGTNKNERNNQRYSNKIFEDNNKRDTIQTHISSSNFLSSQYPILQHQSTLLSGNTNQKAKPNAQYASRQSQVSQKTVPHSNSQQYSQSSQSNNMPFAIYGTALNTCKSLSGDIFTLRPGNRVVVIKIDHPKKLIQCSYQNMQGLFYLRDIAVIEESQPESPVQIKSRTPSTFEVKYKELLNDRFNTRSKSPNYKSTQTRSVTPPKKPFMRF